MERQNGKGIVNDLVVRMRRERDLIEQIKSDYRELNRLNEKVKNNMASKEEKEKLLRIQSWIQVESGHLRETERGEIETIICAEMKEVK
jgi:hypothetical protein